MLTLNQCSCFAKHPIGPNIGSAPLMPPPPTHTPQRAQLMPPPPPPTPHLQEVHQAICSVQAVPDLSIGYKATLIRDIFACCLQISLKQVQGSTFLLQHLLDSWLDVLWFCFVPLRKQSIGNQGVAAVADAGLCWGVAGGTCCSCTNQATCEHEDRTAVDELDCVSLCTR